MRLAIARHALACCLAAAMASTACGRIVPGAGGNERPVVIFTNGSVDMVTVYAIRPGGEARRLASVMPGRTETITLTSDIASASTVTIVTASLAGSQAASSGPVSIGPGVRLEVRLNAAGNLLSVLPARVP